jgi:hypothetical protein
LISSISDISTFSAHLPKGKHMSEELERPKTALTLADARVGSKITVYVSGDDSTRIDLRIVEIDPNFIDRGEYRTLVAYEQLNNDGKVVATEAKFASDLGLTLQENGNEASVIAIPFDEQ